MVWIRLAAQNILLLLTLSSPLGHFEKYQDQLMPCHQKHCGNWPEPGSGERNWQFFEVRIAIARPSSAIGIASSFVIARSSNAIDMAFLLLEPAVLT